jgi:hypothetical protein
MKPVMVGDVKQGIDAKKDPETKLIVEAIAYNNEIRDLQDLPG